MEPCKIWVEQCDAARRIEDDFGTDKALAYLVAEKFLNFLEAAETHADFRAELPAFAAELRTIFEPWQIAECLETARQTAPFDPSLYEEDGEDEEFVETERRDDLRRSANDLLLVERARQWLLEQRRVSNRFPVIPFWLVSVWWAESHCLFALNRADREGCVQEEVAPSGRSFLDVILAYQDRFSDPTAVSQETLTAIRNSQWPGL
jgi:hypothetical protein